MYRPRSEEDLGALLEKLIEVGRETEWIEFKKSWADHEEIGQNISALANSAALYRVEIAYLVWGVEDETLRLVGTSFQPGIAKAKGNEDLVPWLTRSLEPRRLLDFQEFQKDGLSFVILQIEATTRNALKFLREPYIRVGKTTKRLSEFHDHEHKLWEVLTRSSTFETEVAAFLVAANEVPALLDITAYFNLTKQAFPATLELILGQLEADKIVHQANPGLYDISKIGAILFATDLRKFRGGLDRKGVRLIHYSSTGRTDGIETMGRRGYAACFDSLMEFIESKLPRNEIVGRAFSTETAMYPGIALRELVANAIIHQDLTIPGLGPCIEIFTDRIEISNPGKPLIDTQRFLDAPPSCRNDWLAAFMHKANICDERGCGIERVLKAVELFQLPPPDFAVRFDRTTVTLLSPRALSEMTANEKISACYWHAALRVVAMRKTMTNTSLRERFKLSDKDYGVAWKIIRDTVAAGLIRRLESGSKSSRDAAYVPYWAPQVTPTGV
jgi:predicted HTH transcriptional regulator